MNFFSILELNTYIKNNIEQDINLRLFTVEGELSNFRISSNNNMYFNLNDGSSNINENSTIKAVIFNNMLSLNFKPENGQKVIVTGKISLYAKGGYYQILVKEMSLSGEGEKLVALEKLKKKLADEGLFKHKRKINIYPKAIGIIVAKDSAAQADLIKNIHRRYPLVTIYVYFALMQGEKAPQSLINALNELYTYKLDTIIIARGGGSTNDLDAFNNEEFVRKVFLSPFPIISAIGHEIDYTILDYVADKRVSTPTAAAEFSTISINEIYQNIDTQQMKIEEKILNMIKIAKYKIEALKNRSFFINPKKFLQNKIDKLFFFKEKIFLIVNHYLTKQKNKLNNIKTKIETFKPQKMLKRGYAIIKNENDEIINHFNIKKIKINENIKIILYKNKIYANIIKKENDNE